MKRTQTVTVAQSVPYARRRVRRNLSRQFLVYLALVSVCMTGASSCRIPFPLPSVNPFPYFGPRKFSAHPPVTQPGHGRGPRDRPVVTFLSFLLRPSAPFLSCSSDDGDRLHAVVLPSGMYFAAAAAVTIALIAFPPHNPLGALARSLALHSYSGKVLWRVIDVLRR